MKIIVAGLNHKSAPVDVREKLAFDTAEALKAIVQLKNRFDDSEFVLLSTCNRVEIYCACSIDSGINGKVLTEFLSNFHNIPSEVFQDFIYVYNNIDAVRHLLAVSSGMDSMVVGEAQIIGQVKESYRLACEAKSTGTILNRLFHRAFATSKKIRTNTCVSSLRVSVAGVAVELAMQIFSDVSSAKVVVIGAGETGELLVQHLLHAGCRNITVINRSFERGLDMSKKYDIYARRWDEIASLIVEVDIVIASATSQDYLFEEKAFKKIMRHRQKGPLLIIDVAVPRNFAPAVNKIEDIYLYNIDDLSEVVEQNLRLREDDIAKGMHIISENTNNFMDWFRTIDIGPVIGEIKDKFTQIGQKEVNRFFAYSRQDREMMEAAIHRFINRFLHYVIKNVDLVAQKHGTVEATKLVNGIIQRAEEVLYEPDDRKQVMMRQYSQPNQVLRLLFWESTIRCNLACAHCRRLESNEFAKKDLSTKQAKSLIKQLSLLGKDQPVMPVLVFSGGEPLCRDDIFELVGYANSLGLTCALATNGTLVSRRVVGQIKDNGIARVSISLDGATANVHNQLRRQERSFEKAIEGAKQLHQEGVPFQINITLTRQNAHQLESVYQLVKSLGAVALHIFMLVPVGCGQILAEKDMLTPQQYEEKLLEICRLDAKGELQVKVTCGPHYERIIRQQGLYKVRMQANQVDGSVPGRSGHLKASKGCLAGTGVLFVSHQGDVFPCGYLPVKCGNVLKEPLSDIWRDNKDLARMRDSANLEGKCGLCDYKKICGGCRARAYAMTGNYMGEEPFCTYVSPSPISRQRKEANL